MSNVRFVKDYEDYQGLIVTLPNGKEVTVNENPKAELNVYRFGFDMGKASTILRPYGQEIEEDSSIGSAIDMIYQESDQPS